MCVVQELKYWRVHIGKRFRTKIGQWLSALVCALHCVKCRLYGVLERGVNSGLWKGIAILGVWSD